MAISLDAATKRMARAIDAGKLYDAFPRGASVLLRIAPAPLADRLLRAFVALTALVALFRDPASSRW